MPNPKQGLTDLRPEYETLKAARGLWRIGGRVFDFGDWILGPEQQQEVRTCAH
jgi:hypothetical protein